MPRQPKGPRVPEMYRCGNPACERNLLVSGYKARVPEGTAPERVHRVQESGMPPFTLMCTCGHYTVVSEWRDSQRKD